MVLAVAEISAFGGDACAPVGHYAGQKYARWGGSQTRPNEMVFSEEKPTPLRGTTRDENV